MTIYVHCHLLCYLPNFVYYKHKYVRLQKSKVNKIFYLLRITCPKYEKKVFMYDDFKYF